MFFFSSIRGYISTQITTQMTLGGPLLDDKNFRYVFFIASLPAPDHEPDVHTRNRRDSR